MDFIQEDDPQNSIQNGKNNIMIMFDASFLRTLYAKKFFFFRECMIKR